MRVLLASCNGADRTYGGVERYVDDLHGALDDRGHQSIVLSASPVHDDSAAWTVTLHGVDWHESRPRRVRNHVEDWVAEPSPRVGRLLEELAPDLLHTSNLPGITTGIWEQARRLGIPVVHTLHDYHLLCPRTSLTHRDGSTCHPNPLLCGLRTRRLARWSDGVRVVVGVSAHVLGRHLRFFGPATERRVIRAPLMALPGATAAPPARRPAVLGYLGVLTESKGVDRLIDAAPDLAEAGFTLRVAGEGPLRDAVAACPAIDYAGRLEGEAIARFIASCDLGLVGSLWEEPGLTYVLFEWLAGGRPVLATRRGGLAEAAALPGVASFDGTAAGLVAASCALREGDRFAALAADVPGDDGGADFDRWVGEHLDAYAVALARR